MRPLRLVPPSLPARRHARLEEGSLPHSSVALPSDDDAPISEPRPSSPEPHASLLGFGASFNDAAVPLPPDSGSFPVDDAAKADNDADETVTRALTNAFLAKKTTQDRIREVVEARVPTRTQAADVENLTQTANERALTTTSLARSVKGLRPWSRRSRRTRSSTGAARTA